MLLVESSRKCVYRLPVCYVLSTAGRCNMQAPYAPDEVATVTSCWVLLMSVHAKAVFCICGIHLNAGQDMAC